MPRPPRYTAELAERVLHQLRAGRSLRQMCNEPGMPSARTVQGWVNGDLHGFAAAPPSIAERQSLNMNALRHPLSQVRRLYCNRTPSSIG